MDPKAATTKLSDLERGPHTTTCPFSAAIKFTIDDDSSSINHGINNSSNNNGKHGDDSGGTNYSGGFRFDFHLGSMPNSSNGTRNPTHPDLCHEGCDDFAVGFVSSRDGVDIRQGSRGGDVQQESQDREDGTGAKKMKKRKKEKGKRRAEANSFDNSNSENIGTMLPSREDQHRPTKSDRSPTRKCDNEDNNNYVSSTKKSTKHELTIQQVENAAGTTFVANGQHTQSGHSKSITERLLQKNDSSKTPLKSRIKPPPGFQFDPVVQRKGALVNRQSMGLHRQNRSNLSQQHGGVNTKEENDNSQQNAPDAVTNPFTFGFNILGDGLLLPPGI